MRRLPKHLRLALEPAVAVAFLALWIVAEAGREHPAGFWVWLALSAAAIALARLLPAVALALVVVVPVAQLLGVLSPPEATTWPLYGSAAIVAFFVGLGTGGRMRWVAPVAVVTQSLLVGATMVYRGDWQSWLGVARVASGSTYLPNSADTALPLVLIGAVAGLSGWTAGFALQVSARRRADQAQIAQAEVDLAVADAELAGVKERSAIAQEVHDVLAHSLAVVIAMADGSRFLRAAGSTTAEERTDVALSEIADTARTALTDLRGLLEALHDDAGERPQPSLAELPALVERMSSAGMRVALEQVGEARALTPSQELSVYRIVQESLTNALKHGGKHPVAAVSFAWEGEGLALTVVSDGGAPPAAGGGTGARRAFGIEGMKQRARLAGGWLTAEPDADGFIVTAFVPVRAEVLA